MQVRAAAELENRSIYEWDEAEVRKVVNALKDAVSEVEARFASPQWQDQREVQALRREGAMNERELLTEYSHGLGISVGDELAVHYQPRRDIEGPVAQLRAVSCGYADRPATLPPEVRRRKEGEQARGQRADDERPYDPFPVLKKHTRPIHGMILSCCWRRGAARGV